MNGAAPSENAPMEVADEDDAVRTAMEVDGEEDDEMEIEVRMAG